MERLWSPWRMAWIEGGVLQGGDCPFCVTPEQAAELPGLIAATSKLSYATLNLFPYNGGHIMILPYRHVADITDLTPAELLDMMTLAQDGVRALRTALKPTGFNIGLNLGVSAGAGVPGHIHIHVVPRWTGDTNFMPVVAETKVMPEALEDTKRKLVEAWRPR